MVIKKAKDVTKKWAIQKEIAILTYLKWKVKFVPQILDYWNDWFKYEFIEWVTLNQWKGISEKLKDIYMQLVVYAYILDQLNVKHGELSRPTKNIIISSENDVFIIDFERWNLMNKKWKNLRAIGQFFVNIWIININELKNINNFSGIEEIKNYFIDKLYTM